PIVQMGGDENRNQDLVIRHHLRETREWKLHPASLGILLIGIFALNLCFNSLICLFGSTQATAA
ncbi:hypothetical protein ACJX0J_006394, partial [Zea mays]